MTGLSQRLRQALREAGHGWADSVFHPLPDKGLAHDHLRIVGAGALARIPKQSQLGLPAQQNLDYQIACFERAAAGGHAPRLLGWLPPSRWLPRGALLVEEIVGRPARLPADLPAIVRALAALHLLPLPTPAQRPPLHDAPDPLLALLKEVQQQALHLDAAVLAPAACLAIGREFERLHSACALAGRPPLQLIAFDGHPGNFIVRGDGEAVLVDLEKCRYSYPGLDLAHATLYTSTTWDIESQAVLSLPEVVSAYRGWEQAMGAAAALARAWHLPLRRAMWLWSISWCAKWRVLSDAPRQAGADGEDWSSAHSDAALVNHVRNRVDHYLSAPVVASVVADFDALDRALAA